jgi:hypothetical protein
VNLLKSRELGFVFFSLWSVKKRKRLLFCFLSRQLLFVVSCQEQWATHQKKKMLLLLALLVFSMLLPLPVAAALALLSSSWILLRLL